MKITALDLKKQYTLYQKEIDLALKKVIESTSFIQGKVVRELEEELAKYLEVRDAIACSSGTDALFLSLAALGIRGGDEVITTPFTFIATAEAISYLGATPVFVDCNADDFNICDQDIKKKITPKTKAILPVSLFGAPSNMKAINQIAQEHELAVIEDAAQSIGGSYYDKKSGNLSSIAATSFFPSKPLGGYGDGGAVMVKNNSKLAERVRILLNHGQTKKYHHTFIGINGRLDSLQAAVLKVKLRYLDEEITKRNQIATAYKEKINPDFFTPQKIADGVYSAYAQFSLIAKKPRKKLLDYLSEKKIPWAIYYPIPLHLQKAFSFLKHKKGDFPNAEKIAKQIFSLPIHPFLSKKATDFIIKTINNFS